VLEIVERLCSHIAIIHKGHIVANGSLDELRAGVQARLTPATSMNLDGQPLHDPTQRLTLEQIFLNVVGGDSGITHPEQELTWLS
jgi:ABC-2 type transport system ATP-binding protein